MRKSRTKTGFRPLRAGIAVAATAAAVVAGTGIPAYAGTVTLSTTQVAATTGGTIVNLIGSSTTFTGYTISMVSYDKLAVRFVTPSSAACPTNYANASATSGATTVNAGLATVVNDTSAYITAPAGLAVNTTYLTCLYAVRTAVTGNADLASGDIALTGDTTAGTVTAVNMGMLSGSSALPAEKVTLTAPSAIFTASTYATQLYTNATMACPLTYSTASSTIINAATAKTSTSLLTVTVPAASALTLGTPYLVCSYAGSTVGTSALAARGSSSFAVYGITAQPTLTVAPSGGSSGTSTSITVTASSGIFTGSSPGVLFTKNACPATYAAGSDGEPYAPLTPIASKISTSKIATTVPTTVVVGGFDASTPWNVCAYVSTSSGALAAAAGTYNVAPVLTVNNAKFATAASSAANTLSGPAQGGQQITVSGLTGIPSAAAVAAGAKLSATLGGSPLTGIAPIDATSFSATTPAHGAGAVTLSVTTAAGTKTTTAAHLSSSATPYTYTYGITVTPNTAAVGATAVLDITGAGFNDVTTWGVPTTGAALAASTGYVLLTNNAYYGQTFTNLVGAVNGAEPISYCANILPISDNEIICTLNLGLKISAVAAMTDFVTTATANVASGTYTVTVLNDGGDVDANEYSIISSGSTFTVAPF